MNDIYLNLIIIAIIIILFLSYILIGYFYNNYKEYKVNVDDSLHKTSKYINSTNIKLSSNIENTLTIINNNSNSLNNNIISNNLETSSRFGITNSNLTNLNYYSSNDSNNLYTFDTNIKNYIQFRDGANYINEALYNHIFDTTATPNRSLKILSDITALSGMTVKTTAGLKTMQICDDNVSGSKCINMDINTQGDFNIYPDNNNISNINIYNKDKLKVLAKFDLNSNNIYLGRNDENAGIVINESNVFVKNINFLKNGSNYTDAIKSNDITQQYNINDLNKLNKLFSSINGIYTIIKSTDAQTPANTLIINFQPKIDIAVAKTLTIPIYELNNTIVALSSISITNDSATQFGTTANLSLKNIILTTTAVIPKGTNIRIRFVDTKITVAPVYTEPYITNTFTIDYI